MVANEFQSVRLFVSLCIEDNEAGKKNFSLVGKYFPFEDKINLLKMDLKKIEN